MKQRLSPISRYVLIALALIVGLKGFQMAIGSLSSPFVYRKDLLSEYLLARAVRAGVDPYQSIPQLIQQLRVQAPIENFKHPSPHPPALALFCLPLAWLDYERAAAVWFVIQCLCQFASVELLLRWWRNRPSYLWSAIVTLFTLGFGHAWEDLIYGQVNTVLLLLFLLASIALRRERQVIGGVLLALAIAVKFIGWPLLILLAMRRKWMATVVALSTLATINLAAVAAMGWSAVVDYYLRVGPLVMTQYRAYIHNWSLWSVGWRLFDGTGSPALAGIKAAPLVAVPRLAPATALVLVAVMLVAGLWMAHKTKRFENAYGILISTSLLISPLMWPHYLLLMAIPALLAAMDLRMLGFPREPTLAAAILGFVLFAPDGPFLSIVSSLAFEMDEQGNAVVPFAATLVSMIPIVAAVVATIGCYRLSKTAIKQNSPQP